MVQSIHCCFNCRNMYVQLHSFMSKQERLVVLNSLKVPLIMSCKCVGALRMNIWTPVNPDNPSNHRTSVGRPTYAHSGSSGCPRDVRFSADGVRRTSRFTTSVRPKLYVLWMFDKNLQNHKCFINEKDMFPQRTQHPATQTYYGEDKYTRTRWNCFTRFLAVLNSYIPFPKEIIIGVGEVLQKG